MLIFTFHGIGPIRRAVEEGERNCWLDQEHFEAVLEAIPAQSTVQLTFDDANASDAEIVLPALLQRGLHATFFVCSGRVGRETFLTAAQLRDLARNGMSIGSHGIDHVDWRRLPPPQLRREAMVSRIELERIIGRPVSVAACPFGSYDHRVLRALRAADYDAVYTSDGGGAGETRWLRSRTTITRRTSAAEVRHLVEFGLRPWTQWMIGARTAVKRIR